MFANIYKIALVACALMAGVMAKPTTTSRLPSFGRKDISFNNWGGFSSLAGFDNFHGRDNFVGRSRNEIFVKQDRELVCHTEAIRIIQQRLLVIQELAKRVITEQICEVETQTIVFEQFYSSSGLFSHDLRRLSHRHAGYDAKIAGHFKDFFAKDGSLSKQDFGFTGRDLGKNIVVVRGSNWNDITSPATVGFAYYRARSAFFDYSAFV